MESEVRHTARAGVLGLEAVIVVEAALDRMSVPHFRQTDRDILGPVDVQKPWKKLIGRSGQVARGGSAHDAAAPAERRRQIDLLAIEPDRVEIVQHAERVVARVDDAGVRVEQRKAGQARQPVRGVVDEDAAGEGGSDDSDRAATGELVPDEAVRPFQERRRAHLIVHGHPVVRNVWIWIPDVVESLKRARSNQPPCALP